jgi:hypothetical protein
MYSLRGQRCLLKADAGVTIEADLTEIQLCILFSADIFGKRNLAEHSIVITKKKSPMKIVNSRKTDFNQQ